MKFTASEIVDIVACVTIALALFFSMWLEQHELSFSLSGALGGVLGVTAKNKVMNNREVGV